MKTLYGFGMGCAGIATVWDIFEWGWCPKTAICLAAFMVFGLAILVDN